MNNSVDFHCPYPVGSLIADKYRVEKILGKGGMGIVLAARHIKLDEAVAIKLMLQDDLFNENSVERFLREARACVKLKNNEHIARVSDVDTLPNGLPYMVMELLDGCDLDKLLKQRGVLPIHDACSYTVQACRALKDAHQLGIIHRDLKPQNLFLTRRRDGSTCVKVLDFGISKHTLADESLSIDLTRPTDVLGSLYYMSPEQARSSRKVFPQSDIYSLGAVLYKLLTGRAPFPKKAVLDAYEALFKEAPPPPSQIRRDIPPQLENVILRCLDKQVERRFANVAELMHALAPFTVPRELPAVDDRDSDVVTTLPRAHVQHLAPSQGTQPLGHVIPQKLRKQAEEQRSGANPTSAIDRGVPIKTQPLDAASLRSALHGYLPPNSMRRPPTPSQSHIVAPNINESNDVTPRLAPRVPLNPAPNQQDPGPRKPMDSVGTTAAPAASPPQATRTPLPASTIANGTMYVSSANHLLSSPKLTPLTHQPAGTQEEHDIPWHSFPAPPGRVKSRRKLFAFVGGALAVVIALLVMKFLA